MTIEKGEKEKMSIDKTPVTSVMKPAAAAKAASLKEIAGTLVKEEEVFIEGNGRLYVVAPKDITELIAKGRKPGIYVQIANLGDVDTETNARIDKKVHEFVRKTARIITNLQSFVMHVERHEKQGKQIKYSVRARLLTPLGLFVSKSWGWSLATVFQDAIDNLEREIMKQHDKIATHQRAKKSKMMRE